MNNKIKNPPTEESSLTDFYRDVAGQGGARSCKDAFVRLVLTSIENKFFQEYLAPSTGESFYMIYEILDRIEREEIRQFGKSE